MQIAFLHTAEVHVDTFNALMPAGTTATHVVRPDLLERARQDGIDAVRNETISALVALKSADAVICSCSTLGPLADAVSGVIRIDRPMMERAISHGRNIAVAICLDSTRDATLTLLQDCAAGQVAPRIIRCTGAWAIFETGDMAGYACSISDTIKANLKGDEDCIVLAQASMAVAAELLRDCGLPVLTSPQLAVDKAVASGST